MATLPRGAVGSHYPQELIVRPTRRVYSCREHGLVDVPISDLLTDGRLHIYPEVTRKNYFRIYLKGDRLALQAGPFIGLIPINDKVAIDVRPRVPLPNLDRLLRMSGYLPVAIRRHLRYYAWAPGLPPSMLDLLAEALIEALWKASAQGLHREYQPVSEDTSFPRGRVLVSATVRRHRARGQYHRAAVAWFQNIVDTAANRCLKYAIWHLAQRYNSIAPRRAGMRKILSQLNAAYQMFAGVKLDRSRAFLNDPLVQDPGLLVPIRATYPDAVRLAAAIISDRGVKFEGRGDDVLMSSLLINLQDVFEAYVRVVIQAKLEVLAPHLRVLDGNVSGAGGGRKPFFDLQPRQLTRIDATPDVVISEEGHAVVRHPLTVEVKYKAIRAVPERDDLNQAIAYGVSYRSPKVVLVHPFVQRASPGLRPIGRIGSVSLYAYAFDLQAANLETEEDRFVSALAALVAAGGGGWLREAYQPS